MKSTSVGKHSRTKILAVALLILFTGSSLAGLIASTPNLNWNFNWWPRGMYASATAPSPGYQGIYNPSTAGTGSLALSSNWNTWITSVGCPSGSGGARGTYVNTTTVFDTTVNETDSVSGSEYFGIQDNIGAVGAWQQFVVVVAGNGIYFGMYVIGAGWGGSSAAQNDQGAWAYLSPYESLSYYPASAGYSIQQSLTYSGYVPNGIKVNILHNGGIANSYTASLPTNITQPDFLYQTVLVGGGSDSYANFVSGSGEINYESNQTLTASPQYSANGQTSCVSDGGLGLPLPANAIGETSDISYDANFPAGVLSDSIAQQWISPASSHYTGSPAPVGTHSYFGLMTLNDSISGLESSYPDWHTFGSSGVLGVSSNYGLEAEGSGGNYGLVNSSAVDFSSTAAVLSFQVTGSGTYATLSSSYSASSIGSSYLSFGVSTSDMPTVYFDKGSGQQTLAAANVSSAYSAWLVVLGVFGTGLQIYLNVGNGFVMLYDSPQYSIGFDTGYVYVYGTSGHGGDFAYVSNWNLGRANPLAEGTFDQNMWYMVRHYELITGGTYSGDAVILDSDAPPLYAVLNNSKIMYAGQSNNILLPGAVLEGLGVNSTTQNSQTLYYLFCYASSGGSLCANANELSALEAGGSLSGNEIEFVTLQVTSETGSSAPNVEYTITSESCSSCSTIVSSLHFAGSTYSTNGGPTNVTIQDGAPGQKYVTRHITEVTGLLLDELGYSTAGNKLLSFMSGLVSTCAGQLGSGCSSPYYEFYSPMFPTQVNNSALPIYYFDTKNAFPGSGLYSDSPSGTNFQLPNSGPVQYSFPYVSRLSIPTAQNALWLDSIMNPAGYDPTEMALKAEYMVNTGVTNATKLIDQLNLAGWNGVEASQTTCVDNATDVIGTGLLHTIHLPTCYTETAAATYTTAAFLSAASAVASETGNPFIAGQANQAASVLESMLWSGNGSIAGDANVQLMWQQVGGESSAYGQTSQNSGILQYATNQGGTFGEISGILEQFGVNGIQPPETPGYEPVATEATGLTAAALLNYIKYLSGQPSAPRGGAQAAVGVNFDTIVYCSNTTYCNYSNAATGQFQFHITGNVVFNDTVEIPYTISQPIESGYAQAAFEVNGSSTGGVPGLGFQIVDPLTSTVIDSRTIQLPNTDNFINETFIVPLNLPNELRPGTYLAKLVASCSYLSSCDFMTNGGFVEPIGLSIRPNTLSNNFVTDADAINQWNTFALGQGSGLNTHCSVGQNGYDVNLGLDINASAVTTGDLAECGVVSQTPVSYNGGPLIIQVNTNSITSGTGFTSSFAISPELIPTGTSTASTNETATNYRGIEGTLPDYLILENGGDGSNARVVLRENNGTATTYTISDSDPSIYWLVMLFPTGGGAVLYRSATSSCSNFGGCYTLANIPLSGFDINNTAVWTYLYSSTTSTTMSQTAISLIHVQGASSNGMTDDTGGQMNDYGAMLNDGCLSCTGNNIPGTGPMMTMLRIEGDEPFGVGPGYVHSANTTYFNRIETVAFWMMPQLVGGNNSGSGSSTMVVDYGGAPLGGFGNWAFGYTNLGGITFQIAMSSGSAYSISSLNSFTALNVPYYVTGVYNPSANTMQLYVDGKLVAHGTTSGFFNTAVSNQLYIGTGLCASGTNCYNGYFDGGISGLTISPYIAASATQIAQMMNQGYAGSQLGGGYWYPLVDSGSSYGIMKPNDLFGVGPSLSVGGNPFRVSQSQPINDFPYPWSASIWNPYLNPYESSPNTSNPYEAFVNQTYGIDSNGNGAFSAGPSLEVLEDTAISAPATNSLGGFNLAPVDLSTYTPGTPLVLSFEYRVTWTPDTDAGDFVVIVTNATGTQLFRNLLGAGQIYSHEYGDTGWQTFSVNVAPYINGSKSIDVFVGIQNEWSTANYHQKDFFGDMQLQSQTSHYALSLYRDLPSVANGSSYSYLTGTGVMVPNYTPQKGSFSMSIWFETSGDLLPSSYPILAANGYTGGTNKGFEWYYCGSACSAPSGEEDVKFGLGNGTAANYVSVAVALQTFAWYNAQVQYNATSGQLCEAVDGSSIAKQSGCVTAASGWSQTFSLATGPDPITFGFNPGNNANPSAITISDYRLWNYSISAPVQTQVFYDGPTSNLAVPNKLWLPFDGSFADALGSGMTVVPYVNSTSWYNNYASFIKIPGLLVTTSPGSSGSSGTIGIDGSAKNQHSAVTSVSVTLSTSHSPDVIVVYALSAHTSVTMTIADTDSLTWHTRTSDLWTSHGYLYEFYATANSPLSSDSITVTQSASDTLAVIAFGVDGANTATPFDTHSGLPATASGTGTSGSVSVSTSNSNDLIIGLFGVQGKPSMNPPTGFTVLQLEQTYAPTAQVEYKIVTSAQSSLAITDSWGTSESWFIIGDALQS